MIRFNQVIINDVKQVAKTDNLLMVGFKPVKEYIDGKLTEKVIGYNYTVVCPSNKYEQFNIKIEQIEPVIKPEELEVKGGAVKVKVKGFEGRFYQDAQKNVLFTAKAAGIEVLP